MRYAPNAVRAAYDEGVVDHHDEWGQSNPYSVFDARHLAWRAGVDARHTLWLQEVDEDNAWIEELKRQDAARAEADAKQQREYLASLL